MRSIYRFLSILGDVKAASRGPGSLARRKVRSRATRSFSRGLRGVLKP